MQPTYHKHKTMVVIKCPLERVFPCIVLFLAGAVRQKHIVDERVDGAASQWVELVDPQDESSLCQDCKIFNHDDDFFFVVVV